jgi:hypothetical protein
MIDRFAVGQRIAKILPAAAMGGRNSGKNNRGAGSCEPTGRFAWGHCRLFSIISISTPQKIFSFLDEVMERGAFV